MASLNSKAQMNIAIIVSSKDPAGINIKTNLLPFFKETKEMFEGSNVYEKDNIKLYTTSVDPILCENIDKKVPADFFLFATKHQSAAGKPSFAVHSIGNFGDAQYGGRKNSLVRANPHILKELIITLQEKAKETDHEVSIEATHHGPWLEKPCTFIEIGSSIEAWENKAYGKILAETIMNVLKQPQKKYQTVIVLGGSHYNHVANKLLFGTNYAVGHICPKHHISLLTKELLLAMMEKSNATEAVLDWKGIKEGKKEILGLLEENSIPYRKSKEFLKSLDKNGVD